jgi:hypothetical protein
LAARRAGKIAASSPTTIVAIAKAISCPTGIVKTMKPTRAACQAVSDPRSTDLQRRATSSGVRHCKT